MPPVSPFACTDKISASQVDAVEAATSDGINKALHSILETTSKDYGHAVRSVHAKSHGLLDGTLRIFNDLPEELAQGLAVGLATHQPLGVINRVRRSAYPHVRRLSCRLQSLPDP